MNKTILMIDDDELACLIVEKMMHKIDPNLTFIACENGKVGLDTLFENKRDNTICIIILDLNMPVLDGWGFLDVLKTSNFNDDKNLALYILSSSTDKRDIEKAGQYPIVKKFYHKPLSIEDIIEILNF
ncbi:MAG: response regulator [Chitinophagaceae bacterium]|jgi:CheY-like chemotaxis protein|nr:response regulator [Chitinophagaceae bacterium]